MDLLFSAGLYLLTESGCFFPDLSSSSLHCEATDVVLKENKQHESVQRGDFRGTLSLSPKIALLSLIGFQRENNLVLLSKVLKFNIP